MITDVPGVRVGHWTELDARTGCTAVLLPLDTVASAEVRGGAPASRRLDLLAPGRLVERVDAVLLTGGSAHGLAAADGVMRWCEEHGLGFETPGGAVPIVPTLALYDLAVGDGSVRPDARSGHAACEAASHAPPLLGTVGAATGATTDKWRGPDHARPGGFGAASRRQGAMVVAALVAVNAFGTIDRDGAGAAVVADALEAGGDVPLQLGASTTIGVVVTNARLTKTDCWLVAQSAHDGLARSVAPVHTRGDGDAFVTCATGTEDAPVEVVRALTVAVVEAAVRSVDTSGELEDGTGEVLGARRRPLRSRRAVLPESRRTRARPRRVARPVDAGAASMSGSLVLRTHEAGATQAVAGAIGRVAAAGDLLILAGELGAGKTTFAQGFAVGLGITDRVTSPTFTLVREYEGPGLGLRHLDVYRLEQLSEATDLGLAEMLDEDTVMLIEWGDAIVAALPADHLDVRLTFGDGDDDRRIELVPVGVRWSARMRALGDLLATWIDDGAEPC